MSNGFERRKAQSREEIRKAAWELFGQFGVERVSVADVARKAGVSQATIYNNFGSKEALVREFVTVIVDQMVERFQEMLTPEQPFWDKMATFIRFISEMMAEARASEVDALAFTSGNLLDDPEIRRIRDSAEEKMTDLLLGLVEEGRAQGHIPADLSGDAFRVYFKAFMNLFTGPQFRQLYYKDPSLAQDLGSLMIHGMRGPRES